MALRIIFIDIVYKYLIKWYCILHQDCPWNFFYFNVKVQALLFYNMQILLFHSDLYFLKNISIESFWK